MNVEFIRVDNQKHNWPIAKAYNEGARRATADNLMFVHEDVLFENNGWGIPLIDKLAQEDCGVIGFVGSPFRLGAYAGWCEDGQRAFGHYYYVWEDRRLMSHVESWSAGEVKGKLFEPTITVDGLCMIVPRRVWAEFPFDEEMLTGFHCYDIDFCLTVAQKYHNYVYLKADCCHFSNGNMDGRWYEMTMRINDAKWRHMLPMAVEGYMPSNIDRIKARADYDFAFKGIRGKMPKPLAQQIMKYYVKKAINTREYRRKVGVVLWQYFIHRAFRK